MVIEWEMWLMTKYNLQAQIIYVNVESNLSAKALNKTEMAEGKDYYVGCSHW